MINEEIKTHINERIEALKLELESKFIRVTKETEIKEDGVWGYSFNGSVSKLFHNGKLVSEKSYTEFEDGFWYKSNTGYKYGLYNENNNKACKGFYHGDFCEDLEMLFLPRWQKVTDFTELEELLKKEAVKSGMIDGAIINQSTMKNNWVTKHILESNYFEFKSSTNILYCDGKAVFYKGTWAEVVKEKTTEDWLNCASLYWRRNQADNCVEDNFIDFFKQNKLKIIQEK